VQIAHGLASTGFGRAPFGGYSMREINVFISSPADVEQASDYSGAPFLRRKEPSLADIALLIRSVSTFVRGL
jgi:hypothetical protein